MPWNILFLRLTAQFYQTAMEDINKDGGKLEIYRRLKTRPGHEKYLTEVKNIRHRIAMTRLRLSSHTLNIETGRHTNTDRADRLCTLCKEGIEDETHMLITCPMYTSLRLTYLSDFSHVLTNNTRSDHEKAIILLKNRNLEKIAHFVYEAFEIRSTLIDSLTTLNNIVDEVVKGEQVSAKVEADVSSLLGDIIRTVEKNEIKQSSKNDNFLVKSISSDGLKIVLERSKSINSSDDIGKGEVQDKVGANLDNIHISGDTLDKIPGKTVMDQSPVKVTDNFFIKHVSSDRLKLVLQRSEGL